MTKQIRRYIKYFKYIKFIYPIGAFLLGLCVYFIPIKLSTNWASYLSLSVLAAMDSIIGGIKANMEGKFDEETFLVSFIFNALVAAFLAYLGDKIGLNLFLAALIALGGRIFINISIIRNYVWKNIKNKKLQIKNKNKKL